MTRDLLVFMITLLLAALIIMHQKYRLTRKKYINSLNINNTLIEISNEISQVKDIDELYQKMLEYTIKLIKGAQFGSILIYDKLKDRMEYRALCGYDTEEFSNYYLEKEQLYLYTLNKLSGPGIIINPLASNKHPYNQYEHELLNNSNSPLYKSILSAPLYIDGDFFGCINVDNIDTISAFSKKDIEIIRYICVHLEIVIKNMLLVNDMKQSLITDSLTGLFNRRYYNNLIENNFNNREPANITFIMIDLDNFKMINDTYGHSKGDDVLKYFSNLLKSRFRKSDTIVRFAGDEFLLVLNDCDEQNAERILSDIEKELYNNPILDIRIGFSYGISKFRETPNAEEVVKIADLNMYLQKTAKKEVI